MPVIKKVTIFDPRAIQMLRAMEAMSFIKLDRNEPEQDKPEALSKRFRGCLHLSDEEYKAFHREIREGREAWERRATF